MKKNNIRFLNGIVRTVGLLTIITIISKILGLLREMGIASIFGVGLKTDAFYLTLIIPALLFTSVGIAIQNLFIIEFTKVKEKEPDPFVQSKLSSNISNILLLISIVIFIISFIFTPLLIKILAPGFKDAEKFNLTVRLTRILLPTMIIIPLYQVKASILRVYDKFVVVAIIDLAFNVFQILYLLLFSQRFDIVGLTYSITFAYLFQFLIMSLITYKMGFRFRPVLNFKDEHFRFILKLFIPTFISFGIIQINASVDKIIASNLGDGAISALNYGFMLRTVLYSIIITSILMVVYPLLLKYKTRDNKDAFNKTASRTLSFLWIVGLFISIIAIGFNESIVRILFERGAFSKSDTLLTSQVFLYYMIGMAFFAIKEFLVYISYAHKDTKIPLLITLISAILNVIFSIILKEYMGVSGIALGLSISEAIGVVILFVIVLKKSYIKLNHIKNDLIKIFIINILLFITFMLLKPLLYFPTSLIYEILILMAYTLGLAIVYIILSKVFRVKLFKDFLVLFEGETDEG